MSMKTIMRGLVVACAAALGLNAWAAVGDTLTYSTVDISAGIAANGGSYTGLVLTIPSQDGLPNGSVVTLQKIVAGLRNGNYSKNADYLVVLDGANNHANATACVQGDTDPDFGNARPLTFDGYSCDLVVGQSYTCQFRDTADGANKAQQLYMFSHESSDDVLRTTATTTFSMLYTVTAKVKTIAADPVTYTCTVDGTSSSWDPALATLKATDSLVYTGSGTVDLPTGATIVSSITIGEGVTLNVTESGLVKSKVTNNGTIKVTGGTEASPIVITEDQGSDTTIGTIQIAANSCLQIDANGAGNKKYTVTGDSATTSTLILASNHDWGLTDGSVVRNAKVIVTHKCWWERTNAFDESIDLVMQGVQMVTCNNDYTIGSITCTGSGSFSRSGNATITVTQPRGDTTFAGSSAVPLTVNGSNTLTLTGTLSAGLTVGADATVKIAPASGSCDLPTIAAASAGKLEIASGTVNVQGQRVALNVLDGATVKIVATLAEIAAGSITLPVPAEHAEVSTSKVTVVDQNGETVTIIGIAEGTEPNTIVISLQTNAPITESCNLSEKITGKTGMIVVQGATGEAEVITITVDCAIQEGLQLSVTGKADFAFGEGSEASAGTIKLENGAVTTVSGTINNTITISDGATLITSGAVTFGEGKQIARSANNKNATLTIGAGSTLTLAAADSINTAVALNVVGTLDLGGQNVQFKSNPAEATYTFYAGATVANGTVVHQGGYNLDVAIVDSDSEDKVVHFTAVLQTAANWGYVPAVFTTANGTSIEFTQAFTGNSPAVVRGATKDVNIMNRGEYRVGTQRSLKGDVVVGAGTTLSVTVGDGFEYENNKANLDVYGTINVNANRQTLSSSNQSYGAGTIKLHDGAQIIGAGASHKSTTVGLDIWNATTITVDGTVTISTPIYGEAARSSVSFVKAEGAETAVVNMTGLNTLNGGFKVGDGVVVDCGADKATKYAVTLQGGTLKWAGAGNAHGQLVKSVTLEKDSRMECTTAGQQIGIGVAGSAETSLDLAGFTLTMKAAQAGDRIYFDKTSITSAGTLEIEQGTMFIHCKHLGTVDGVNLVIGENASAQVAGDASFEGERTIEVANLTYNGTLPTQEHPTFVVSGTFKGTGSLANLTLSDGATIDVAEVPESGVVASATQTLMIGDISTIKLAISGVETTDYTLSISEDAKSVIATAAQSYPPFVDEDHEEAYDTWLTAYGSQITESTTMDQKATSFAFNCAPTAEAIAAAQAAFKVTITMTEEGPQVTVVTADGVTPNIAPVVKGKVSLSDKTWHDQAEGDHFFRAEIVIPGQN